MSFSRQAVSAMMLAFGVSASVSPAQTNYIPNGDFSAPLTITTNRNIRTSYPAWAVDTNNIVTWDKVNGHNAPGCIRIKADTVGEAKSKGNRVVAPIAIHGPEACALGATKMQLKFWVRSGRADGGESKVFARCEAFLDHRPWSMVPNGFKTYPLYNQGPGTCGTAWQECIMTDIPVTNDCVFNFHFLVNDTDSEILVDDITFTISEMRPAKTAGDTSAH